MTRFSRFLLQLTTMNPIFDILAESIKCHSTVWTFGWKPSLSWLPAPFSIELSTCCSNSNMGSAYFRGDWSLYSGWTDLPRLVCRHDLKESCWSFSLYEHVYERRTSWSLFEPRPKFQTASQRRFSCPPRWPILPWRPAGSSKQCFAHLAESQPFVWFHLQRRDQGWTQILSVSSENEPLTKDHFKIIKTLGKGDVGTVHLVSLDGSQGGKGPAGKCLFALKSLKKEEMQKRNKLGRVKTEKTILESLDHPFLPTLWVLTSQCYTTFIIIQQFLCRTLSIALLPWCPEHDERALRIIMQKTVCLVARAIGGAWVQGLGPY